MPPALPVVMTPGAIYTVQSEEITERAKEEGWCNAKMAALMPKNEQEFWQVQERDGIAHISHRFKRTC